MAEAGHKESSALSEEPQRFWLARTALRGYLTARSELHWRVRNLYNKTDAFTKAVEGLGGVGDFQSCADECAYIFWASTCIFRGSDSFSTKSIVERWRYAHPLFSGDTYLCQETLALQRLEEVAFPREFGIPVDLSPLAVG